MQEVEERRSEIRKARIIVFGALAVAGLFAGLLIGTTDFAKGNIIEIGAVILSAIVIMITTMVFNAIRTASRS